MVAEDDLIFEGDFAAQAHKSLQEASSDLSHLAQYCEDNFHAGGAASNHSDEASTTHIQGGEAIKQTAEFALQAINAIAVNVRVLADDLSSKLAGLDQDLAYLTSDVNWIAHKVKFGEERYARRQIRKLAVRKHHLPHQPAIAKVEDTCVLPNYPKAYTRKPVDITLLDHVGLGGFKESRSKKGTLSRGPSVDQKEAKMYRSRTGTLLRSSSRVGTLTTSTATLNMMKMPSMPKAPPLLPEKEPEPEEGNDEPQVPTGRRLSLLPPMPDWTDEARDGYEDYAYETPLDDPEDALPTPPVIPGEIQIEAQLRDVPRCSVIQEEDEELDRELSILLKDMDGLRFALEDEIESYAA